MRFLEVWNVMFDIPGGVCLLLRRHL